MKKHWTTKNEGEECWLQHPSSKVQPRDESSPHEDENMKKHLTKNMKVRGATPTPFHMGLAKRWNQPMSRSKDEEKQDQKNEGDVSRLQHPSTWAQPRDETSPSQDQKMNKH